MSCSFDGGISPEQNAGTWSQCSQGISATMETAPSLKCGPARCSCATLPPTKGVVSDADFGIERANLKKYCVCPPPPTEGQKNGSATMRGTGAGGRGAASLKPADSSAPHKTPKYSRQVAIGPQGLPPNPTPDLPWQSRADGVVARTLRRAGFPVCKSTQSRRLPGSVRASLCVRC